MYSLCFFFFFKQKTAYEMRISDWSSDVCSSDLPRFAPAPDVLEGKGSSSSSFESAFSTTWQPEKEPTGPVSIILRASDARDVVVHNGLETGSTPIAIRGRMWGLQAFTIYSIDKHGKQCKYLPLPGSDWAAKRSRQASRC